MHAKVVVATIGIGALAAAFACSSSPTKTNNCGSGAPPDLRGTYTLTSYLFGSQQWTAPTSSGSAVYTATTYQVQLRLATDTIPLIVHDSGSYQFVGATCIMQTSALDTTRFSASIVLQTVSGVTTLRESGSDGTHEVIFLWTKL